MQRAVVPIVRSTIPRRLASSLLLLHLTACGTDTGVAIGSSGTAATTDAPTTGSNVPKVTSTDDTSTATTVAASTGASTSGPASETDNAGTTTGTSGEVSSAGDSSDTGDLPPPDLPPPDACADQDDPPPAVDPPKAINDDPAFIQVYINNIENLKIAGETCEGDWTDLIYDMKTIDPSPDLFLVQQVSDTAQLEVLVARMNAELPGIFEGIIADADPWTQQSPCGKEKAKQTNAVIFRQGRFAKVGDKHVWQSWANKGGECVRNNQARTRNVMVKLHDKIADRDVTVASMHWSTSSGAGTDPACAMKNVLEADEKLHKAGFEADLLIFGGDFNEPDRKDNGDPRPWYGEANGDDGGKLNYRDPIYRACQSDKGLQACLDDNVTTKTRIDIIFGQDGEGCRARTRRAHTITFAEAEAAAEQLTGTSDPNLNYSDHRSVRAEFYYR